MACQQPQTAAIAHSKQEWLVQFCCVPSCDRCLVLLFCVLCLDLWLTKEKLLCVAPFCLLMCFAANAGSDKAARVWWRHVYFQKFTSGPWHRETFFIHYHYHLLAGRCKVARVWCVMLTFRTCLRPLNHQKQSWIWFSAAGSNTGARVWWRHVDFQDMSQTL